MKFIFVYITNPNLKTAKSIAKHLLEKKLIACANIHEISSIYRWKGRLVDEKEFVLIGKTTENNYGMIVSEVKKMHPYETPCIIKIPVEPNKEYSEWLLKELKE